MTLPAVIFGFVLASVYGALFHLLRGGGLVRLLVYLVIGWVGFAAGQALASALDWTFDLVGTLHVGVGSAGALLFLIVGNWLSLVEVDKK